MLGKLGYVLPMNRILILLAMLVVGNVYALPPCPASGVWHNCFGSYTFDGGEEYIGEWRDGQPDGQGTFLWPSGDKYVGGLRNNQYHGHGTYTWADGSSYVGGYRENKEHGYGIRALSDGLRDEGQFKDGDLWNGQIFRGERLIARVSNGKETPTSTAFASLSRNEIFEFVATLFLDEELGVFEHVWRTKEETLTDMESDYKKYCIDDASFYGICEVHYHGDVVLSVWEAGGIIGKETALFFED